MSCSVSNALVAARLAVVCTDKLLYAKALAAFWHVHATLEASIAKNANHEGGLHSLPLHALLSKMHKSCSSRADTVHARPDLKGMYA